MSDIVWNIFAWIGIWFTCALSVGLILGFLVKKSRTT